MVQPSHRFAGRAVHALRAGRFGRAGAGPAIPWTCFGWATSLVYGVVVDKVSTLISSAFILIGLLTLIYSGGYLSSKNRDHPEHGIKRRYYFFLLVFIRLDGRPGDVLHHAWPACVL